MSDKPYIFYISGMTCISCKNTVESYLRNNATPLKIKELSVDVTTKDPKITTVTIEDNTKHNLKTHKERWTHLKNLIEDVGFICEDYPAPQITTTAPAPVTKEKIPAYVTYLKKAAASGRKITKSHWFLGALGCITGIGLIILSLASGGLPLAALIAIGSISTVLTLILGARSFYDAWKKLFNKSPSLTMDTLFTISAVTVLAVSIASFFVPWLPMMFDAGLLIFGFRHIGIAIEDTIKEKVNSAKFQDRAPKEVSIYSATGVKITPLAQINPEHIILMNPGQIIPIDGFCENESALYTTIINGSIVPRLFRIGEKVLAGMRLAENSSPLKIRVARPAKDSYLARLDAGISQSLLKKAPLEIKTGKLLTYFIPAVLALAVLSGIIIGIFFPPALAIQCAVSVLVAACPCTLGLIIPFAVKTGIHKAAEHGVQFKNAKVLQEAEQIDTIVLDLHGTLTVGAPKVKQYELVSETGITSAEFLSLCATLEADSSHPIGKAIYSFAQKKNSTKKRPSLVDKSNHSGIMAEIDGHKYTIGDQTFMQVHGITTKEIEQKIKLEAGDNVVFVAKNKQVLGYLVTTDPLRTDAVKTIRALTDLGKEIHLCTGADEKTAKRYAQALGIKHVYANAVATSLSKKDRAKPAYINALKKEKKKIAMVGDAANDAQALASSDLGIAIMSPDSDELTQKHAGAVIQNGALLPIASVFAISRQAVTNINQNLISSLVYNIGSVLIAGGLLVSIGFVLNPGIGVALMAVQACLILLNVFRFKHQPLKHLHEQGESKKVELSSSHNVMTKHNVTNKPQPQSDANPKNIPASGMTFFSKTKPNADLESHENTAKPRAA